MAKVIILRGLPGSGKSTRAKELMATMKKTIRVNKDDMRQMMHFGGFNQANERMVVDMEYRIVEQALTNGYNVIVDDTNFNGKHEKMYRKIAEPIHEVEVVFMNTPVQTCIERDKARGEAGQRTVGPDVIKNMAFDAGLLSQDRPCKVFDMDGTIADCAHRQHFVNNDDKKQRNWSAFFNAMDRDTPRPEVIAEMHKAVANNEEVIICSARPEDYRQKTIVWLKEHNVPYDRLIMRRSGDYRADEIVKQEFLDKFLDKRKIVCIWDDRPKVIAMWRKNGLTVVDMGSGNDF